VIPIQFHNLNEQLIDQTIELLIRIHHPLFDKEIDWLPLSKKFRKSLNDMLMLKNHSFIILEIENNLIGYVFSSISYDIAFANYRMIILNLYLLGGLRFSGS